MKRYKRILCIFLSVLILFFGVNNTYFSPHKIETVEAAEIVVGGGVVITASAIIEFLCAIAVAGLSIGLIVEWSDMDIEAVAEDLHAWCRENYDAISGYVAAMPGIQQWINADEWVVVIDFASGGSAPEPSPSPDNDSGVENPPATSTANNSVATDYASAGLTSEEFAGLLSEHHGFSSAFKTAAGITGSGITLASFLTPLAMTNEAGQYIDAEGNILDSNDPRIASIKMDEAYAKLAAAYVADKVANYSLDDITTDPIMKALQNRYQPALIELPEGYAAWSTTQIVKWNAENLGILCESLYCIREESNGVYKYDEKIIFSQPVYCFGIQKDTCTTLYGIVLDEAVTSEYTNIWYKNGEYYTTQNVSDNYVLNNGYTFTRQLSIYDTDISHVYSNVPIYDIGSESIVKAIKKIGLGLSQEDLLSPFGRNYIDTNDEFGWASTAQLSPLDLLALGYGINPASINNVSSIVDDIEAAPGIARDISGRYFSFPSLYAAINDLRDKLEEQNPNSDPAVDPVVYPDSNTYYITYENVVTDPEIFPETSPSTDTETNPGNNTDTGTSPNYSGFLQTIINILQGIWDLLKQFLSWFIIDFPTIKAHLLSALTSIPEFDVFEPILGYFDYFRTAITDNYDYPVISITTPDILLPYYQQPEIILVDFEDYAKYFVWARAIISFSLYFGFGIWLIKDIKIFFSGL